MSGRDMRSAVLLSMQRALWEHVTPDLRGVAVRFSGVLDSGASVNARFLYAGSAGVVQREGATTAEAHFAADFLEDLMVSFDVVEFAERDLAADEEWVYLRWEETGGE